MRVLRGIGTWLWRFMVIFSFIVNIVLIVILLLAGVFIFQIKNQVADPLIGGLHSTAAGLGEATIDWTIPVRDRIPVVLNIPLSTDTVVVLTDPVPLEVPASIDLPGLNAYGVSATVRITLPEGLSLPVALNLNVPVNEELDVALDVRAVIPVSETQLADPIETLGLLFEPLAIGLYNLPNNFNEAGSFVGAVLNRDANTPWANHISTLLLSPDGTGFNQVPYDAWLGYSRTAGLDYNLSSENFVDANEPMETGLVPPGGIPSLDSQIDRRGDYYQNGQRPADYNTTTVQTLTDANIPPYTWNGSYYEYYLAQQNGDLTQPLTPRTTSTQPDANLPPDTTSPDATAAPPPSVGGRDIATPTPETDSGMIPTPSSP
jgi:hypothetical protein